MDSNNNNGGGNKTMMWVIAVAITGLIVFLIFKNMSTAADLETAESAITSLEQAKSKSVDKMGIGPAPVDR